MEVDGSIIKKGKWGEFRNFHTQTAFLKGQQGGYFCNIALSIDIILPTDWDWTLGHFRAHSALRRKW